MKKQEWGIWSVRVQEQHERFVREGLTKKTNFLKKDDFREVNSIAVMCGKKISERTARINALMQGNACFV